MSYHMPQSTRINAKQKQKKEYITILANSTKTLKASNMVGKIAKKAGGKNNKFNRGCKRERGVLHE